MSNDQTEHAVPAVAAQGAGTPPEIFEELTRSFSEGLKRNVNHEEFICRILKVVCEHYGANWCGALNADLPLGVWTPEYWYDAETGAMKDTLFYEYESSTEFERWVMALKKEKMVAFATIEDIREQCPNEYEQYLRLEVKSLLGVPYYSGATGFVVVKNPTINQDSPWVLMAGSYIIGHELQDIRREEAARFRMAPGRALDANEVRISLFGRLQIQTAFGEISDSVLHEQTMAPVLVYLLLRKDRPVSGKEICEKLWQDPSQEAVNKLKNLIYRFRKNYKGLFSGDNLISTLNNGYWLNPEYKIVTDTEEFDSCINSSREFVDKAGKIRFLSEAVSLYQGDVFPPCCTEQWLVSTAAHYESRFRKAFNELMGLLNQKRDYERMIRMASHALQVAGQNEQFYLWLIIALARNMSYEQARGQYEQARLQLGQMEFVRLTKALEKAGIDLAA